MPEEDKDEIIRRLHQKVQEQDAEIRRLQAQIREAVKEHVGAAAQVGPHGEKML